MLSEAQINEFAERGCVVVPQVMPGDVLDKATQRIDEVATADPPAGDKRGAHFYFLETKNEPALIAPLTSSPASGLAEGPAGHGTLKVPWQVQISLNIPPHSHRTAGPTSTPSTPSRPAA